MMHVSDEAEADAAPDLKPDRERIKLAGAWSHLDWEEAERYFDRISRDAVPTPQIDDL